MPFHDVLDNGQPEPRSARRAAAAGIGAIEPPRQVRQVLGLYAFTLIANL